MESDNSTKQMPLNDITNQVKNGSEDVTMASSDKTVTKRNGEVQALMPEKIQSRLENLLEGLATKHISLDLIIKKTVDYS